MSNDTAGPSEQEKWDAHMQQESERIDGTWTDKGERVPPAKHLASYIVQRLAETQEIVANEDAILDAIEMAQKYRELCVSYDTHLLPASSHPEQPESARTEWEISPVEELTMYAGLVLGRVPKVELLNLTSAFEGLERAYGRVLALPTPSPAAQGVESALKVYEFHEVVNSKGQLRGPWRFAFDIMPEWRQVQRMTKILEAESPKKKQCYVLIGNEPIDTCYERARKVIEWGCEPYCQPEMALDALYKEPLVKHDWTAEKLRDFARYFNRHL